MSDPKDFMRRHWEAIEAGDYERLRELLQPNCELVVSGTTIRGRDNFVKVMRAQGEAFKRSFSDLKYEIRDFVHSGDTIVCENRLTGSHERELETPMGNVKPTNRRVVIDGCDYVKLESGKVKSWHAYSDGLTALTQLGLISPKGDRSVSTMLGLSEEYGTKDTLA
jgi:ketosteroid isomerase-like protein